jgi:hypothetical protein
MSFFRNNITNSLLFNLSKKALVKNKKFQDIHHNQKCYIFGNGASIKYFDLSKFSDRISIGCGLLFLHKDFNSLNMPYYFTGHPFFYYPYWTNPYSKSFEKNLLGSTYKLFIKKFDDIEYFVSLTNYLGLFGSNINYVYHYDEPFSRKKEVGLSEKFIFMESALAGMLGIACYMGFKDIILVGCDYVLTPKMNGHFYEYGQRPFSDNKTPYTEKPLRAINKFINISSVTVNDNFSGDLVSEISYKSLTNLDPNYNENFEIVDSSSLITLDKCKMDYRIFNT